MSGPGGVDRGEKSIPVPIPSQHRKKEMPAKPVEQGIAHVAKVAKSAGMPITGTGQEKPITAPRPARTTAEVENLVLEAKQLIAEHVKSKSKGEAYQQKPMTADRLQWISGLKRAMILHPNILQEKGFARDLDLIREDVEINKDVLENKPWNLDFANAIASAFVKAYQGARPFTEEGNRLFLEAGDKKQFPKEEERTSKLLQAIQELPTKDKVALWELADFMSRTDKAQKGVARSEAKTIEKLAKEVAPHFTDNEKEMRSVEGALTLLARHKDHIFRNQPFSSTETQEKQEKRRGRIF